MNFSMGLPVFFSLRGMCWRPVYTKRRANKRRLFLLADDPASTRSAPSSFKTAARWCTFTGMTTRSKILYASEPTLDAAEFRRVLVESGLGATRPIDDEARLKTMLASADMVLTARLDAPGKPLIGLARGVTDFSWVCYISELAEAFLGQAGGLGPKLAVLLVQLPPSLSFEPRVAEEFFGLLRKQTGSKIACEPRHASWFEQDADALLTGFRVARVAADPARVPAAATPSGWPDLVYFRLHGAPRIYYSDYDTESLIAIRQRLDAASAAGAEVWCIFDNTVKGHALGNAVAVDAMAPQITFSSLNALPSATRLYPNAVQSTVR
ncbi:DUF72 domain-containing protein [Mesorhizobium sp. M0817]|uniref:DUF72 domain-containing protein n=1 Tax=Mesorhizobium sp. M0817 TaxID=2957007 RepID=UPI003338C6B4